MLSLGLASRANHAGAIRWRTVVSASGRRRSRSDIADHAQEPLQWQRQDNDDPHRTQIASQRPSLPAGGFTLTGTLPPVTKNDQPGHRADPEVGMGIGSMQIAISRPEFPRFLDENEPPPPKGWAIAGLAKVYKDAQPVGILSQVTISARGDSVLVYDYIRAPPS
jgi:hypothetical protein